jgi:hypothetical protein
VSEPPDPPSPLIQLELELEAAAKATAETERSILEYLRWEIAALEEREPSQWVLDYLGDRQAALMRAWRIKDGRMAISEAMKIGAVLRSPIICDAQKLLQRAKALRHTRRSPRRASSPSRGSGWTSSRFAGLQGPTWRRR